MSASDNLATVEAIYDAFGRADVQSILDAVCDDVDWATDGATGAAPWYGPRTGKTDVVGFVEALGGAVDVHEFTPLSYAANDEDEVHTLIRFTISSRLTGRKATMNLQHYWRFRGGKVACYRGSEDTALTAAVFDRSPAPAP